MEKKQNKIASVLMNLDIAVASAILAILIVLTFLGVIWRYIFDAPFTWLEEVQTSCLVFQANMTKAHGKVRICLTLQKISSAAYG